MIFNGQYYDIAATGVNLGAWVTLLFWAWFGLRVVPRWRKRDALRRAARALPVLDNYGRPVAS
jgi:hypothetical protein